MGTKMQQFDKKAFRPTKLTAPDGREFTASTLAECNDLITRGYLVEGVSEPDAAQVDTDTVDPASLTANDAATSADAQALAADPAAPAADETAPAPATGKAAGRRSGGAQ